MENSNRLGVGIRSTQVAAAVVVIALLAALGFSAFRNADARDRESAFLGRVEATAAKLIALQQETIDAIDTADDVHNGLASSTKLATSVHQLQNDLTSLRTNDDIANGVIDKSFDAFTQRLSAFANTQNSATWKSAQSGRWLILRDAQEWSGNYQSIAVARLRTLSEDRATNERNQAILLLLTLLMSVWILAWVGATVARNYQRAKVLIATEEVKVQSARSALAHASDQLSYQAHHDSLTGLLNRTALMENLDDAMKDIEGGLVTIFFCDLDRFKVVNDSLGHSIGDELLIEAANRLVKTIGEDGYVGRFGGDEFVVVCRGLDDSNAALRVAERISRALTKPFDMHGEDAFIGVSIGIANSRPDITAQQLLRDADVAMYRAKGAPGNHIEFFDAAGDMFSYRFNTETALRKALTSNQFLLHWQPIVNLKNSQVHTLEALVRWERPGTGLLLPKDFMAIAEDSGLIVDLGRWVIAAACSAGALTDDRSVAVNISVRQLRDVRFVDDLRDILSESGLPPERLILEVTEHSVIDTAIVTAPLARVRELGVRVALDDFGTGYSSLALLPKLPVDIVKLDRAFMKEIVSSEPTQAVVKSIVQLTSALNVMLIVEGVESDAQRKLLRSLGVQHGQGYWFGQPEPGRLVGSHVEN
ncbi:MAG: hypothetical protein RL410_466 [Actinomycetota bacterium]